MNLFSKRLFLSFLVLPLFISTSFIFTKELFAKTCYYGPGDTQKSGDDFYRVKWGCSTLKVEKYWDEFNMIPILLES